ncbi:MAG: isoleucyl-tRNA synthetase [Colwellia sp.]|jgi:isoleucyl-tRNA synthetase
MKFAEYKGLDLPGISTSILKEWKDKDVFKKSVDQKAGKPAYVFYEGPPSANGMPGIHHAMARTIKDIFPRYKTMKGFQVKRKAGWDTHGLPIELGVEKALGITKEDIGTKISVADYNKACREAVMRYTDVWNDMTDKVGYWVDMEDPYITYQPKYMESVWWLLKEIYNKGLIYKGYTIQPYSPKAGTGLSSHELNQPGTYQDVTDTTVTAQFKSLPERLPIVFQGLEFPVYFLAWTTTPWTLPSNTALTVGPKIEYVLVSTYNQYTFEPINVVLAKALVGKQFSGKYQLIESKEALALYSQEDKHIPYLVGPSVKGSELVGIQYEQLIKGVLPHDNPQNAFRVIAGDFVTTEDGTGIVHTAPTFGADDALVAKQANPEIPAMLVLDTHGNLVPLVDLQGKFRPELGSFAGKYVKNEYYPEGEAPERSVDVEIAITLKEENKAFKVEKYVHSYPHCWRTDKPILYYPLDSWFIKVTDVKDRMVALNHEINWKPKATGEGRFGNWLANANDWNLSRSRYWGIPLPIWRTADGKEEVMIGSVAELKEAMAAAVASGVMERDIFEDFVVGDLSESNYEKIDLHKNIVDQVVLVSASGQAMYREADLIDVWFDSGSMPYAQWHYPFENKEFIDNNERFPADFIAEGVDQTRGWFYTLHAIATMVFDRPAFKNVVSNGMVLDKDGKKMSKRLGNAIDPFETIETHGADATRWYMISNANPWDNLKFDTEGIVEVKRKFFGTLYNTYSFFSLYANLDSFDNSAPQIPLRDRSEIDRWVLSELNSLILRVEQAYEEYEPTKAARAISDFVQENLSNWYVRLCRRRFWKGEYGPDKLAAYQTLYNCLLTVSKLSAPIAPFFMDRLYLDLASVCEPNVRESVHLEDFPAVNLKAIDSHLERKMQLAQNICSLVLSIRQKEKIKVRQPLQKIMIPISGAIQAADINEVSHLILSEVNVKEIELMDDSSGVLVKQIKPDFKALGPKFGTKMKSVTAAIQLLKAKDINEIEQKGVLEISIEGEKLCLELSDVVISSQDIEGWLVASEGPLTVALDATISPKLKAEGIARELVNRIQNLRKDSGFEVTDKIVIKLTQDPSIDTALLDNLEYIKMETLATEIIVVQNLAEGLSIAFDEVESVLFIEKQN